MPVRLLFSSALAVFALAAAACGSEIGDSCLVGTDCDPNGQRICDNSQPDGYCTIDGCDYNTCPGEAECVRFYIGQFTNRPCNPDTEDLPASNGTNDCNPDEACTLAGQCVPRSAEVRFCMRKCSSQGDCRDQYECRDQTLMVMHGGEPVLAPGQRPGSAPLQSFCGVAPATTP